MRYYFHVKDGATTFDDEGMELPDVAAVKKEALLISADLIKDGVGPHFWTGRPWILFVTDQPNGGGNTILSLALTARLAS
jgi:hypothetical protein